MVSWFKINSKTKTSEITVTLGLDYKEYNHLLIAGFDYPDILSTFTYHPNIIK